MKLKNFKLFEQENSEMVELANRIYKFLDKYAGIKANYDPEYDSDDEKYSSPDAAMLRYFADSLMKGKVVDRCWSEWSGGGYEPYSSRDGRNEHDEIMNDVYKMIKSR